MNEDAVVSALKMIPYGFFAVTTSDGEGEMNVMVANWISQVSFTPRLVAFGLARKAHSHEIVSKGRVFGLNIFRKEDGDILKGFTKPKSVRPDKLRSASYSLSEHLGLPVIQGAAAFIELKVTDIVETGGDHDIVIGEAVDAQVFKPGGCEDTLTLMDLGWSYAG